MNASPSFLHAMNVLLLDYFCSVGSRKASYSLFVCIPHESHQPLTPIHVLLVQPRGLGKRLYIFSLSRPIATKMAKSAVLVSESTWGLDVGPMSGVVKDPG